MAAKIVVIESNNIWTLTSLPPGKESIGYRWICKIKYKSDGSI